MLADLGEPGALEAHVIVGVEIVEAVHRHAAAEQAGDKVEADEARRSGHEHPLRPGRQLSHVRPLSCADRRALAGRCNPVADGESANLVSADVCWCRVAS